MSEYSYNGNIHQVPRVWRYDFPVCHADMYIRLFPITKADVQPGASSSSSDRLPAGHFIGLKSPARDYDQTRVSARVSHSSPVAAILQRKIFRWFRNAGTGDPMQTMSRAEDGTSSRLPARRNLKNVPIHNSVCVIFTCACTQSRRTSILMAASWCWKYPNEADCKRHSKEGAMSCKR